MKKTRVDQKFTDLKKRGQKGFIAYLSAGDPNLADTVDIVLRLEDAGVDLVELGLPFSDPLADGPVIQASHQRALKKNVSLADVFKLVKKVRNSCIITLFLQNLSALGLSVRL